MIQRRQGKGGKEWNKGYNRERRGDREEERHREDRTLTLIDIKQIVYEKIGEDQTNICLTKAFGRFGLSTRNKHDVQILLHNKFFSKTTQIIQYEQNKYFKDI